MKYLHGAAFLLLVIGGLNWLLSVFSWDLAAWGIPMGALKVVYVLVGLAALFEIATHKGRCKECAGGAAQPMQ